MPRIIGALVLASLGGLLFTAAAWNPPVDRRIVELTHRHAEQQTAQNERLANLQQQWQRERADLYRERDLLEVERRELDRQRQREPVVAQSILQVGTLAMALLPLAVCVLLLRRPPTTDEGNAIAETLVEDLMSPHPTLLIPQPSDPTQKPLGAARPESSPKLESPVHESHRFDQDPGQR